MARMADNLLDCLVIGGGPAGLAASVQLGRLRRSNVIVDDDAGRSLFSQVTRNHLGFPDGVTAANLRILGLKQADRYGAELVAGHVARLRPAPVGDGAFEATIEPIRDPTTPLEELAEPGAKRNRTRERRAAAKLGESVTKRTTTILARTVLVATGVVDEFPQFPDRDLCVGISLFWCIVCDGFESIGRQVTVVGDDEHAVTTALGLTHFTPRVTLITNRRRASASPQVLAELERRGIEVVRSPVESYHHTEGQIERLVAGGRDLSCEMVFVSAPKRARSGLARHLGAQVDRAGYVITDDAGRTNVRGLYAAGDVTAGHSHQVTTGAHLGATAATAINWDLYDPFEQAPFSG
jgi:thioredoxin reductase (NADPH)